MVEELGRFGDYGAIEVRDETVASVVFISPICISVPFAPVAGWVSVALVCIRFGFYRFIAYSF